MKNRFFLFLGAGLVLFFFIIIAGLLLRNTFKFEYYFGNLSSGSPETRQDAIAGLAALPDEFMEKLRSKIADSPDDLRWAIFQVFKERGEIPNLKNGCARFDKNENCLLLIGYFHHTFEDNANTATGFLEDAARFNPALARHEIVKTLSGGSEWKKKSAAINALALCLKNGRIPFSDAEGMLKINNPFVVYGALCALSDIGDNRTAPLLAQFAGHKEKEFAFTAMWGLSNILEGMNPSQSQLVENGFTDELTKTVYRRYVEEGGYQITRQASNPASSYPPDNFSYSSYVFLQRRGPEGIENEITERMKSETCEGLLLSLYYIAECSDDMRIRGGLISIVAKESGDPNDESKKLAFERLRIAGTCGLESELAVAMENCSDGSRMQALLKLAFGNGSPKLNSALLHVLCRFYWDFNEKFHISRPNYVYNSCASDRIAYMLSSNKCAGIEKELGEIIENASDMALARYLFEASEGCDNEFVSKAWLGRLVREDTPYDFACSIERYLSERKARGIETAAVAAALGAKAELVKINMVRLLGSISAADATRALYEFAFKRNESEQIVSAALNSLSARKKENRRDISEIFEGLVSEFEKGKTRREIADIFFTGQYSTFDYDLFLEMIKTSSVKTKETLAVILMKRAEVFGVDKTVESALVEFIKKEILSDPGKYPACVFGLWLLGDLCIFDNSVQIESNWYQRIGFDNCSNELKIRILTVFAAPWTYSLDLLFSESEFLALIKTRKPFYEFLKRESYSKDGELAALAKSALQKYFPSGAPVERENQNQKAPKQFAYGSVIGGGGA